jgi:HEAT repeat protein
MNGSRYRFWLTLALVMGLGAYLFSPRNLGPVPEYRIVAWLKYWQVLPPRVQLPDVLASDLGSDEERVHTEAAQAVGLLEPHPTTLKALLRFIDRPEVSPAAKDIAIWSLGELRATEALRQLRSRIDNEDYDQENLLRAIEKIETQEERSFFPD